MNNVSRFYVQEDIYLPPGHKKYSVRDRVMNQQIDDSQYDYDSAETLATFYNNMDVNDIKI